MGEGESLRKIDQSDLMHQVLLIRFLVASLRVGLRRIGCLEVKTVLVRA